MFYNAAQIQVQTENCIMNCIRFGSGTKTMVLISGLNLQDVRGIRALSGLLVLYRSFAQAYTVYCFDRRENVPEGFSIEDIAQDIADGMDALHLKDAYVLAVSQGGMAAQVLAARRPDLVKKMVLGVTACRVNETITENIRRWCLMAERSEINQIFADYALRTYSKGYLQKYGKLLPLAARFAKMMDHQRFIRLAETILSFDCREILKNIRCSVLVLDGAEDHIVTAEAGKEIASILRCERYVYPGYGHSVYEEQAADINRRVREFFNMETEVNDDRNR